MSTPFFNFSDSPPLGKVIKIYSPSLSKGGWGGGRGGGSKLCLPNNYQYLLVYLVVEEMVSKRLCIALFFNHFVFITSNVDEYNVHYYYRKKVCSTADSTLPGLLNSSAVDIWQVVFSVVIDISACCSSFPFPFFLMLWPYSKILVLQIPFFFCAVSFFGIFTHQ